LRNYDEIAVVNIGQFVDAAAADAPTRLATVPERVVFVDDLPYSEIGKVKS
jgi:hypothetical protein